MPRSNIPVLNIKDIQDLFTRKNFQLLMDYFGVNNQLLGFNHIEYEAAAAESNVKIAHGLGYVPKDIIMTRVVGAGTITFNYSLFDENFMDVTFTGAARFRAFVGTYWNDDSGAQETSTQTQNAKATVA